MNKKYVIEYNPELKFYVPKAYWSLSVKLFKKGGIPIYMTIYKADTKEECIEKLKEIKRGV